MARVSTALRAAAAHARCCTHLLKSVRHHIVRPFLRDQHDIIRWQRVSFGGVFNVRDLVLRREREELRDAAQDPQVLSLVDSCGHLVANLEPPPDLEVASGAKVRLEARQLPCRKQGGG